MIALPIAGPWLGTMRSTGSCLSWRRVWIQTSLPSRWAKLGSGHSSASPAKRRRAPARKTTSESSLCPGAWMRCTVSGSSLYVRRSPKVMVGSGTPSGGCGGTDSSVVVLCARISRGQALCATMSTPGKAALPYTWSQWWCVFTTTVRRSPARSARSSSTGRMSCGRMRVSTTKARVGVSATAATVGKPSASMRWTQTSAVSCSTSPPAPLRGGKRARRTTSSPPRRLSADLADVLGGFRDEREARRGEQPGVLDADGPKTGQHELGFEGEDHAFGELQLAARQHGQLVELEPHPVADEAHLPGAVAHEKRGETLVGRGRQGDVVEGAARDAGPGRRDHGRLDPQGDLVGAAQLARQFAEHEDACEIGDVAFAHRHEVEDQVVAAADRLETYALGDRRAETGAGQRRVEIARHQTADAGEQLAVEHLLVEAAHADDALVAQAPRLRLDEAGELDLGEAFAQDAGDQLADLKGDGRGATDAFDLPGRLDGALPHDVAAIA